MSGTYRWYYVRDDAMERFNQGERSGTGISATWNWNGSKYRTQEERNRSLGQNQYTSYRQALDSLVEFASWHTGYDWARMDDDWTPEDGSLDKMISARMKDFKRHQRMTMDMVRREHRLRYRSGWICIGEGEVRDECG